MSFERWFVRYFPNSRGKPRWVAIGANQSRVAIGANQSQVVRISVPCTIMQNTTSMTRSILCLKLVAGRDHYKIY